MELRKGVRYCQASKSVHCNVPKLGVSATIPLRLQNSPSKADVAVGSDGPSEADLDQRRAYRRASGASPTLTLSANDPYVGRQPPANCLIGTENLHQH